MSLKLPTTFVPERFWLDLADEPKGVFSPRFRQLPLVNGGGDTWSLVTLRLKVGELNRNLAENPPPAKPAPLP